MLNLYGKQIKSFNNTSNGDSLDDSGFTKALKPWRQSTQCPTYNNIFIGISLFYILILTLVFTNFL